MTLPEVYSKTLAGAQTTGTGKASFVNETGETLRIKDVSLTAGTAPTGAALIVDVNVDGTSAFTAANRPQLAVSTTEATAAPDVEDKLVPPLGVVTVDIDQIGSTVAGSDLTVRVEAFRVATGALGWKELRDGLVRTQIRDAELLPLDVNPA
jgi:hypothetical protein